MSGWPSTAMVKRDEQRAGRPKTTKPRPSYAPLVTLAPTLSGPTTSH